MHLKTMRAQSVLEEEPSPIFDSPTTLMAWDENRAENLGETPQQYLAGIW